MAILCNNKSENHPFQLREAPFSGGRGSNPFLRVGDGDGDTPLIEAPGLRKRHCLPKEHPLRSSVQIFIILDNFVNGFNHLLARMKGLERKSGHNLNNI